MLFLAVNLIIEYLKRYRLQWFQLLQVCLLAFLGTCFSTSSCAQRVVDKKISGIYTNARLIDVLKDIEDKGNLYFSYSGKSFPKDSLVNFSAQDLPISAILTKLFQGRFDFEVNRRYVILTPYIPEMLLENLDFTPDNKYLSISGIVVSAHNRQRLMDVSIYSKDQLISTLSDKHGYFKIKLRSTDSTVVSLTVSKRDYKDASLNFLQTVDISSTVNSRFSVKSIGRTGVDTISISKMLTSARQRTQGINIADFFATRPLQLSLTPGLSTRGLFSTQVVNKASLNLIGGYTAGVNGVEVGGIFNINRLDARYFQVAGVFNLVGGTFRGIQASGVYNLALDTVKGVQLAGFINKAESNISGVQVAILHNEAKKISGLQVGLVNSADSSSGVSIGIVNILRNGFYSVSFSSNSIAPTNVRFKSGTHTFYNILNFGADFLGNHQLFYLGIGAGHDFMLSRSVYISTEADYNFVNRGFWGDIWITGKLLLNYQVGRNLSLLAGPTINNYQEVKREPNLFYNGRNYSPVYNERSLRSERSKNLLGWEVGLAYNSVFKKSPKRYLDNSSSWFLGVGFDSGVALKMPYKNTYGAELFVNRDLGNNLSTVASIGFTYIAPYKNFVEYSDKPNSYYYNRIEATPYQIVPVKVGVRSKLSNIFYIGGDIGHAWAHHKFGLISVIEGKETEPFSYPQQTVKSLLYSAVAGFKLKSGLDIGGKFEHYLAFPKVQQLGLHVAYQIKLKN